MRAHVSKTAKSKAKNVFDESRAAAQRIQRVQLLDKIKQYVLFLDRPPLTGKRTAVGAKQPKAKRTRK